MLEVSLSGVGMVLRLERDGRQKMSTPPLFPPSPLTLERGAWTDRSCCSFILYTPGALSTPMPGGKFAASPLLLFIQDTWYLVPGGSY